MSHRGVTDIRQLVTVGVTDIRQLVTVESQISVN